MAKSDIFENDRVFYYFKEICNIPHGSGNMDKISDFCVDFAKKHNLRFIQDDAKNVIIYKDGTKGYEKSEPIILQGHIDMVCQKTSESDIDFQKDGLDVFVEDDFIKAKNTTLGADNGIAVAIIFTVLESENLSHPPIEAVFTTDEEIGMLGAGKLDMENLSAKRMLNLDMGKNDEAIISCAGGVDVKITLPVLRTFSCGERIEILIDGLKGGHSGGMINEGRTNADVLAGRILSYAKKISDFDILSINGGDKGNVIPSRCEISLLVNGKEDFISKIEEYFEILKAEVRDTEENLHLSISLRDSGNFKVLDKETKEKLIYILLTFPNGVVKMSTKIRNLVETSLNLGALKTFDDKITFLYTLRSNKQGALQHLEEKLFYMSEHNGCTAESTGHYPPWEYNENSEMQKLYKKSFKEIFNVTPKVYAIHAGLECGIFSSKIPGLDCIAIGPDMFDIHTVNERLSISKTKEFYDFLTYFISKCK